MKKFIDIYKTHKKTAILSLSFLLPAFILLLVYKLSEIYPFGKLSLLVMDLNTQYIDFMIYFKKALTENGSLIYSWSKGGGGPLIDLFAYYLSSPFNLFLLLFPVEKMYNAVLFLNLLKIGLSGITFTLFMKFTKKEWHTYYVLFALLYSLSTYAVAYSMCLMWLDSIILLPVILIGTEKIIKKNKCILFIISYTTALISNFYTCYMITFFVVIYFIYRYINLKEACFIKKGITLALSGFSSFLMSLWLILPSIENMTYGKFQKGVLVSSSFFTRSADTFIKQIFPAQCSTITYNGGPNIFCGVIIGLLIILYMINNKFSKKERILSFSMICLFVASFYINIIDVFWHMFQTPTWFPCRYAFLFCFFVIFLASETFNTFKDIKYRKIIISGIILLLIYALVFVLLKDKIPNVYGVYLGIILVFIYTALLILYRFGLKRIATVLLIFITAFEVSVNSLYTVDNLDRIFKYKDKTEFENYISSLTCDINNIKNKDKDFYRIEKDFCRTENDSMSLSYNGIAHYSSSYNASFNKAMKHMGLEQSFIILDSSGITPVFNTIFGVKYFISKNPDLYNFYEKISENSDYTIYKNPYSLPIGFLTANDITDITGFSSDYIENQNILTEKLCGISCFTKVDFKEKSNNTFEFATKDTSPLYFTIPKKQNGIKKIVVNGKKITMPKYTESCIFPLGQFENGDKISITLKKETEDFNLYSLDLSTLNELYNTLNKSGMNITKHTSTSLSGTLYAKEKGTVFTTINYDKNWHIKVNGKEVKPQKIMDAFLGFDIPKGEHQIEFIYRQDTFYIGLIISVLTLITLICIYLYKRYKNKA